MRYFSCPLPFSSSPPGSSSSFPSSSSCFSVRPLISKLILFSHLLLTLLPSYLFFLLFSTLLLLFHCLHPLIILYCLSPSYFSSSLSFYHFSLLLLVPLPLSSSPHSSQSCSSYYSSCFPYSSLSSSCCSFLFTFPALSPPSPLSSHLTSSSSYTTFFYLLLLYLLFALFLFLPSALLNPSPSTPSLFPTLPSPFNPPSYFPPPTVPSPFAFLLLPLTPLSPPPSPSSSSLLLLLILLSLLNLFRPPRSSHEYYHLHPLHSKPGCSLSSVPLFGVRCIIHLLLHFVHSTQPQVAATRAFHAHASNTLRRIPAVPPSSPPSH